MTINQIHIAKTFTWRILASATTFLLTWFITGDIDIGLKVGYADFVIKMILYYFHERAWYFGAEKKALVKS